MKILIIRNAFTHDFGGGERFPIYLAKELQQHGHEVLFVSRQPRSLQFANEQGVLAKKGWWWRQQNWSGARVVLFPVYLAWQVLLTVWYLQLILRTHPDVVHPQSKDDFIAASLAAGLTRKKIVWTDHADLKYIYGNHRVWYKNPVGKLVYHVSTHANSVVLVSNSEKTLIEADLGHPVPSHYTVIHNGVYDQKPTPVERSEADKDAIIFCATSRLVTAKGIGELIPAFQALFNGSNTNYRLWLIGDGPEEVDFKKLAGNDPNVVFFGHSNQPLDYLAASDVFVHPSHHEGFSLSIVEAAMLGKPIIACSVGGNTEIVHPEQNGLLVMERDTADLSQAMHRLAQDPELRHKLGAQARRDFEAQFDFSKIVTEHYLPIYEKLTH